MSDSELRYFSLKKEYKLILEYFDKCAHSIRESNKYSLRKACMYISMVTIAMIFIAKLVVPDFRISLAHLLLCPFLGLYYLINLYTRNKAIKSTTVSDIICLSFYFMLFIIFIFRDMTSDPGNQSIWFPLFLMVFPTVYIARMYKYGLFGILLVAIFCTASYYCKPYNVFLRDVYVAFASYIPSMLCAQIILVSRAKEGLAIAELTKISTIDKLTFLLNKGALLSSINNFFDRRKPGEPCGMCVIDVDNFKQVNDNFGHNVGDLLLSNLGDLLRKNFRSSDYIGRFGGDEFMVFMPGIARLDLVEMRCRSLQMMLMDLDLGTGTKFTLSIGAIIDTGDHPMGEVFRMADDALYQSKVMGKNSVSSWIIPESRTFEKPLILLACPENHPRSKPFVEAASVKFDVIEVHSGDVALSNLSQYRETIRLVIVDLDLEKLSGNQVVQYIKERAGFNHIPVIAVASEEESFMEARECGADRVFFETENSASFKTAIEELIK
ncbi:diguanylate cyclase [Butyrivibrio sp. FC2001]|uniref:diguanylate cyclase n=1 Tax=Butyrivibrio sp. FC2001 TaxID=1280671 RepID=UPI0004072C9F|nr:diguanylate cyclase [Butyrivibrio sp. FC2001]